MPKPSEDTKLTVLNDHYNTTVADFKKLGKSRELNFIAILVLLGIMAFQYISPNQSQSVLTQYAQKQLDINATISINIIGSLIWFALLYAAIRYFQSVINIEKQYNYTHQLESELSKTYNGKAFTREGKAYLNNYAIFSDWVHIVYWYIFPVLFLLVTSVKIVGEWYTKRPSNLPIILDTVIYVSLAVSTVLYVYSLHKTKKNTEKNV
jgi:hypothetical protein